VSGIYLFEFRILPAALLLGLEASWMENASGGGIQRARDFSLEDDRGPLGFYKGIRYGYGG